MEQRRFFDVKYLLFAGLLAMALGFLPHTSPAQSSGGSPDQANITADSIVVWLNQQKYSHVSSVLNYPPSYSSKELADDEAATAGGLKLIGTNLGRLVDIKPRTGVWLSLSYEVSAAGGTLEYWSSLSPMKTIEYTYPGKFERFGKGCVVVRFAKIQSKWQATTIVFQLDSTVPGSRSRAIDIICELYRQGAKSQGQSLPPNLREQVSAQVPDYSTTK